jgi:hypothetical protein
MLENERKVELEAKQAVKLEAELESELEAKVPVEFFAISEDSCFSSSWIR